MNAARKALLQRLAACLLGGVVLAIMIGPQEGTLTDFGISFHKAVLSPRIAIFLAIGVLIFLAVTFWPAVRPYVRRPGVVPAFVGAVTVIVGFTVMNWYDPLVGTAGSGKFNKVRSVVDQTSGLQQTTTWYFDWLGWTLLGLSLIGVGACVITRVRPLGYVTAVVAAVGGVLAYTSHQDVVDLGTKNGQGFDHSLGAYVAILGFAVLVCAGISTARSSAEVAEPREFVSKVMDWRPGLPLAAIGLVLGLIAFTGACWFAPTQKNDSFSQASTDFKGTGLSSIASQYLNWLGWTLFAVTAAGALGATYLRHRLLGLVTAVVGLVGVVLTFLTFQSMTGTAASVASQYGRKWDNLGIGGFLAAIGFMVLAAASVQATGVGARHTTGAQGALPVTRMIKQARTARGGAITLVVLALALFYPPTLPSHWQTTLVVSIGVYVLLSLGLNVVVGWAGLLDLGYIAFFEVGAYTTAYFVGALPKKPPSWLTLNPLETIPFSIVACLIAGVLLGAPTLRLRGDYLAIVTLGFGEIIQLLALNNAGHLTGGTTQAPHIKHPHINLFGIDITWGQDYLPYWYLLLVMLAVVIILFWRLEGSRIGRAWAAIREDEVAAQASGINTTRAKLLAFAIGASTSALAGTFYASQVGYFDPTLFTLQASILIVAYVVFGGMGSIAGAMAGAFVLTWLPEFLRDQVPQPDRPLWIGAAVLAMMIFRPAGLLPAKRRKAELEGLDMPSSAEVTAVPASEGL